MEKVELIYIGKAGGSIPIYKDQKEKYWGDVNVIEEGNPQFHEYELYMDDYDDWEATLYNRPKIEETYQGVPVEIVSDFERNESFNFNYMLLGRLQQDCEYYLGYGNRNENQLWAGNEIEQVEKMKELYNSFPDDKKPQWISIKKIEEYEQQMKTEKKEIDWSCYSTEQGNLKQREGEIIWGSQLEGAELNAKDLEVALTIGKDVDGVDIPNDTPQERERGIKKEIKKAQKKIEDKKEGKKNEPNKKVDVTKDK